MHVAEVLEFGLKRGALAFPISDLPDLEDETRNFKPELGDAHVAIVKQTQKKEGVYKSNFSKRFRLRLNSQKKCNCQKDKETRRQPRRVEPLLTIAVQVPFFFSFVFEYAIA